MASASVSTKPVTSQPSSRGSTDKNNKTKNNNKSKKKSSANNNNNDEPDVVDPANPPSTLYSKAKDYWSQVPSTLDGMLGGYASLNVPDIEDSHAFLDEFGPSTKAYALDCGAGIGRVTKQLLLPRFNLVDMVELTQAFLDQVEEYVGKEDFQAIGERFCAGLQDFIPPAGRYDLIWIQWVLGHLSDVALVAFLQRCAKGLSEGGVIMVKENVTSGGDPDVPDAEFTATFDEVDSSFTRSRSALLDIFAKANLEVFGERPQTNFPKSIYPVIMFALRPRSMTPIENSTPPLD